MPEQHECKHKLMQRTHKLGDIVAMCPLCKNVVERKDAEAILNEYETLKKATDALSAFDAQYGAMCIDIVSEGHGESDKGTKAEKSLRAYANIRKGKND